MQPVMFRLPLRSPWLVCLVLYVASTRAAVREPPANTAALGGEKYRDCSDLPSDYPSGVYALHPGDGSQKIKAYCDMDEDGGGWTVVIRRYDTEVQEYFYRDWDSYKMGFGSLNGEFYWGNEYIWMLTSQLDRRYQVHIWLEDWDGNTAYALYQDFEIESEDEQYRLHLGEYSGDAGDSFYFNDNYPFSTFDRDNDGDGGVHCATRDEAGWWYYACTLCQLTGKYYEGGRSGAVEHGIVWRTWSTYPYYSLKAAVMKIKPSDKE